MSDLIKRLCRPGYDLQKEQAIQEAIIEIRELRARIEAMEQQEPVGTLHDDGCFVWRETAPHQSNYAGWKMALYALPGAQNFADAYQGAMEGVAIWKKRALEAEDLNRKFISEINGPTYMGEPAQPAQSVPDVDALAQFIREIDGKHQLGAGALAERIVELLAASPEEAKS